MASKPKRKYFGLLTLVLLFLLMVMIGNMIGKSYGLRNWGHSLQQKNKKKPREYRYFGL